MIFFLWLNFIKENIMLKILSTIKLIISLALSFVGALLKFVNEGIKPITDETKTNKDNEIQAKISNGLAVAVKYIGLAQTYINKI